MPDENDLNLSKPEANRIPVQTEDLGRFDLLAAYSRECFPEKPEIWREFLDGGPQRDRIVEAGVLVRKDDAASRNRVLFIRLMNRNLSFFRFGPVSQEVLGMPEKRGAQVGGSVSDALSGPGFDPQQLDPKFRLQIALLQPAEPSRHTADEIPLEVLTSGLPS